MIGSLNLLGDGLDFVRDAALGIVWELGLTSRDTTLYLRSHSQDLFRIAGGVIDLAISTTFSWTGLSVALAGVGIDQIVTGFMNIANNTRSNSPIEMIVGNLTGSQTIGQLAPGVLSLGLWGAGRWVGRSSPSVFGEELRAGVNQANLPTRAERAYYWAQYGDAIRALRTAGREGITFEDFARLYPVILGGMSDAVRFDHFWTAIGRISGALSRSWMWSQEVGVWLVNQGGVDRIVINVGRRAYLPHWLGMPSIQNPGQLSNVLSHLGHTHPTRGLLEFSRRDMTAIMTIAERYPFLQVTNPVLAGPTGQWRHILLDWLLQGFR